MVGPTKAAEQAGNSDGAYNLAFCYAGGEGVEKDGALDRARNSQHPPPPTS